MQRIERQHTARLHLHRTSDDVAASQFQRCPGVESQIISSMNQRCILHPHRGGRAFLCRDTIPHINSTVLHSQPPTVQIRHGIHHRGAGIEDFLCRCSAPGTGNLQELIQVRFRILTGKDNIALLLKILAFFIFICGIEFHRRPECHIHRISELNALPRSSRKRNLPVGLGINTPQQVSPIIHLRILFKQDGVVVPDTQIATGINRTAVVSRVPAEGHAPVVAQRYLAVITPINRAAIRVNGGRRSRIPLKLHVSIIAQRYRAALFPINRAAFGIGYVVVGSGRNRVPVELHVSVAAQRYLAVATPIYHAAVGVGGGGGRIGNQVPAEGHALIAAQRYPTVAIPINRAAAVGSRVPAEGHALIAAQRYPAVAIHINRAAVGLSRVPAELHTPVAAQRYPAVAIPINRAASVSRVPAESHAAVVAQRYRAVAIPINRTAVRLNRVPAEGHAPVVAQLYRAAILTNRAAVGGSCNFLKRSA